MNRYSSTLNGLIFFFFLIPVSCYSQFGLNLAYNNLSSPDWNEFIDDELSQSNVNIIGPSLEIGLDYWMRLKNVRVEFYPEVSYSWSKKTYAGLIFDSYDVKTNSINVYANIQVYPMDFLGDCDCPTFSKEGNLFTKGFFLRISPGYSFLNLSQTLNEQDSHDESISTYKIGLGAGLDIGLTDLITISPIVTYYLRPSMAWNGFQQYHGGATEADNTSQVSQLRFGLRIGFRPDYKN